MPELFTYGRKSVTPIRFGLALRQTEISIALIPGASARAPTPSRRNTRCDRLFEIASLSLPYSKLTSIVAIFGAERGLEGWKSVQLMLINSTPWPVINDFGGGLNNDVVEWKRCSGCCGWKLTPFLIPKSTELRNLLYSFLEYSFKEIFCIILNM